MPDNNSLERTPRAAGKSSEVICGAAQLEAVRRIKRLEKEFQMEFDFEKSIALLQITPSVVNSLLAQLSPDWILSNEGEDTWSPFDVVGHFIHGEKTDWIPRAEIILSDNEGKEFAPFDRFAMFTESQGKSIQDLLSEFIELRRHNINRLQSMHITEADFDKTGLHPDLGTVTLRQLISTWVVHDLDHIGQIIGIMARQYLEEVGPWQEYLGILKA
jgi:hypothetical protein